LGYPVTYLFRNETVEAATKNLSKHSLHIYRLYVVRFASFMNVELSFSEKFSCSFYTVILLFYYRNRHSDDKHSEEDLLRWTIYSKLVLLLIRRVFHLCFCVIVSLKLTVTFYASFSVPCVMSVKRDKEPWTKSFLAHMNEKLERCSHVWASLRLDIEVFQTQSGVIVL
jgi:hypothetical protein